MKILKTSILSSLLLLSATVSAHEYNAGSLTIDHPWSKQVPPSSSVAAAFFDIENHTNKNDELIAASSPIAKTTELHAHIHQDGMMKMREVPAITIPANGKESLKPGGFHIMFFELAEVPKLGETFPLTLTFKHAGKVEVNVKVEKATFTPNGNKQPAMNSEHAHH